MKRYFLKDVQSITSWSKVIINGKASLFQRENKAELVKSKITSIYFDSKQRYGSPE
jgi:hypothetical protein